MRAVVVVAVVAVVGVGGCAPPCARSFVVDGRECGVDDGSVPAGVFEACSSDFGVVPERLTESSRLSWSGPCNPPLEQEPFLEEGADFFSVGDSGIFFTEDGDEGFAFVAVTPRSAESLEGQLAVGDFIFLLFANQP